MAPPEAALSWELYSPIEMEDYRRKRGINLRINSDIIK